MNRTNSLVMFLLLPLLAGSGAVYAQNCQNGQTLFTKVANSSPSCSDTNCHKASATANKIANGAGNPGAIDGALNSVSEMANVRSNLNLQSSDLDDIALYLFFKTGGQNCPAAAPSTSASPSSWDFGSIANGNTSSTKNFTISNSGSGATGTLGFPASSTKWPSSKTCGTTIPAGGSCTVTIAYKPAAAGASDSFTYSVTGTGGFSISVSGTSPAAVTPANLIVSPSPVNFGSVTAGSQGPTTPFTLTNTGGTQATGVAFANSNATEFPVSGSSCGATLNAGSNCMFNVRYAPTAAGADNATLTITYTGGGAVVLSMSGTGTTGTPPPPPPPPAASTVELIEYYHAAFDHYFITYLADEITKLDNGTFVGWARTGLKFKAWTATASGLSPVCRFFTTAFPPKSSHFYTPDAPECTVVKTSTVWGFEGEVFYTQNPDVAGVCPAGTLPVYRMYNNGQSGAPNHRYTTDFNVRAAMIADSLGSKKWIPEGAGSIGVIMCAPP